MARTNDPLLTLPDKSGVLYVRLYQRIRALILQGHWPVGTRLPSSRQLAIDLGISRNTATLAIEQLLSDGWVEARSRAGVFVTAHLPDAARRPPPVDRPTARVGNPPVPFELAQSAIDAFPIDRWAKLQAKVWARAVPDLLYETDSMGDPGLRQAIADLVAPARGLTVDPADIMIVTSTKAALDLIAATLPPSSAIIVENPGYVFADAAFGRRGHRIVAAPVDDFGLDVAAARALEPRPAVILTTPAVQFPGGRQMSAERRMALLDWAGEVGAWVVDDDFDADARFDGQLPAPPLKSEDRDGRVIFMCSLNRLLFGSLRLGFIVVPPTLRDALLSARRDVDEFVNLPNQLVLRDFIEQGGYAAHLRRCREIHQARRAALLDLLKPYFETVVEPGVNQCGLWLTLRPRLVTATVLAGRLRGAGIACMTVADFTRGEARSDGVLLGFAPFSPDVIEAMRPALDRAMIPPNAGARYRQGESGQADFRR